MMWRRFASVAAVVAVLTSCSDSGLLDALGERSHEYVQGSTTIPVSSTSLTDEGSTLTLKDIESDTRWYNDGIDSSASTETAVVISAVWQRGNGQDRFIQASPREVSVALPGIQFPARVPTPSRTITSQLVYDTASATLDAGVSAAFGLWAGRPYRTPDDQLAVLRVGQEVTASGEGMRLIEVDDGITLIWTDGVYQYELFCLSVLSEPVCRRIARSSVPLEIVVGPGVPED